MSLLSNELDFFLAVKGFVFNPEAGILMCVIVDRVRPFAYVFFT